jgi:hypothetical protein
MIQAKYRLLLVILLAVHILPAAAQDTPTRPSPTALTSIRYKDAYIKITYCQPKKRGREIFGKLVPFGEVWRTGANEATELTLTRDVFVNNTLLVAGTYSLFTILESEKWTIIINKDLGLWGSYNYNPKMDVLRFEVPVQSAGTGIFESFTIQFDQRNSVADLLLLWDKTKVSIPLQFIEPKP